MKPAERGKYQYVSCLMGISVNPFLSTEAGAAYMKFKVTELLKIWAENTTEIGTPERKKLSLGLPFENGPETIRVLRSEKRVDVNLGDEDNVLFTNLWVVWSLLRPSSCPNLQARLNEEANERITLSPMKDEELGTLNVIHTLTLPHNEGSKNKAEISRVELQKKMEPGNLDLANGSEVHSLSDDRA